MTLESESRISGPRPGGPWTLANGLTAARLLLAPVMAMAILNDETRLAGGVFVVAIATDLADGRVARRRGEVSVFGGIFDHATDAIFVASGLLALAAGGRVTAWLPGLLLFAFAQYALDSKALAGRPLRASQIGRWNGIGYFIVLGIPVIRDVLGWSWPSEPLIAGLAWALVLTTIVSVADRAVALASTRR